MDAASLRSRYERDGFVVLPGFASVETCDELRAEATRLVADFDPSTVSVFSTLKQTTTTDAYFLSSGDKVSFFFEENAFDDQGRLKQEKERSINKIGHALAGLNPVFRQFTHNEKMRLLAQDLGISSPRVLQSMYIFKQPRIGGKVRPHQDSTFIHTLPNTTVGFWIALEDATKENGCLWAIPGSHSVPLPSRFVRSADAASVSFQPAMPPNAYSERLEDYVPVECRKGSMVVLHGHVIHLSQENASPLSRHAYTFHVMSAASTYAPDNWLQRPASFPFQPL